VHPVKHLYAGIYIDKDGADLAAREVWRHILRIDIEAAAQVADEYGIFMRQWLWRLGMQARSADEREAEQQK